MYIISICFELNACVPPKFISHEGGALIKRDGISVPIRRDTRELAHSLSLSPVKVKGGPENTQRNGICLQIKRRNLKIKSNLLAPQSWTSLTPGLLEINVCYLCPSSYGILL